MLAKPFSRLGIHVDPDTVMISTPLDQYEADVYELAKPHRLRHLREAYSKSAPKYNKKK